MSTPLRRVSPQEASQMAGNNRNWLDSIKELPGWITGFIAFISQEAQ